MAHEEVPNFLPIYYVISENATGQLYYVPQILAVIEADIKDTPELYRTHVLPLTNVGRAVRADLYRREPINPFAEWAKKEADRASKE